VQKCQKELFKINKEKNVKNLCLNKVTNYLHYEVIDIKNNARNDILIITLSISAFETLHSLINNYHLQNSSKKIVNRKIKIPLNNSKQKDFSNNPKCEIKSEKHKKTENVSENVLLNWEVTRQLLKHLQGTI